MCIRDSTRGASNSSPTGITEEPLSITEFKLDQNYPNPFNPCLLYTSDAADERSSVDLGGRRIIKKKKTLTYSIRIRQEHKTKTKYRLKHKHKKQLYKKSRNTL